MSEEIQPNNVNRLAPDATASAGRRVAVVIPVYNRSTLLARCLRSLAAQEADDFEVHVCDDGSEEDIGSVVASVDGLEVHYHSQPRAGFGAGRARNLGARQATADIVVFLDSDCIVPPDFVARHRAWHGSSDSVVVIGTRANPIDAVGEDDEHYRAQLLRLTSGLQEGGEGFRAFVSSNVSVARSLFLEVGGFDERFRWWGSEDTELGWRLWQSGATFVFDPQLLVDHQKEEDSAGGIEGRAEARRRNSGLLASLVPHRFYRKAPPTTIPETPKVSVVLHDFPEKAVEATWKSLLGQPRSDFELVVVADPVDHDPFAGSATGDPRLSFAGTLEEATDASRAEYLCYLNGHGAISADLLAGVVKRLDERPTYVTATVGYALPPRDGGAVRSRNGAADVDRSWGQEMPLCWFIRKREASKLRAAGLGVVEMWRRAEEWDRNRHWPSAAVRFPGLHRSERPDDFTNVPPDPVRLAKDLVKRPREAVTTTSRYLRARREGTSYTPVGARAVSADPDTGRPRARYVGWTGRFNLGDDVMLDCIRDLVDWADIEESGNPRDLIILGGGTLINRRTYLRWIAERDSPRIERAVLGTGVANPEFWGLTEDPERWVRWLSSCAYVGVRGPRSAEILRSWGYKGELEVCGDSALCASAGDVVERVEGRVVLAPAWTKGELWGGSDEKVVSALAEAVGIWRAQGREVLCLASSPEDDGQILELSRATGGQVLPFLAGYKRRQEAIDLIASAEVVVGERLHACILAAAVSTPFVGIEYRPKLRDFAESVDRAHLVAKTDSLSGHGLVELAAEAVSDGTTVADTRVEEYRDRLRQASAKLEKVVT